MESLKARVRRFVVETFGDLPERGASYWKRRALQAENDLAETRADSEARAKALFEVSAERVLEWKRAEDAEARLALARETLAEIALCNLRGPLLIRRLDVGRGAANDVHSQDAFHQLLVLLQPHETAAQLPLNLMLLQTRCHH